MTFRTSANTNLPHRQRGFSLLELVAAFVVFALGFGALMQILSGSLRNARLAADYTQAALWAQTKLDTEGFGEHLKEGHRRGEFDDKYRWQLDVQKYQFPDTNPQLQTVGQMDLYRLDLTVSWGSRADERSTHFVTLRAALPDPNAGLNLPGGTNTGGRGQP